MMRIPKATAPGIALLLAAGTIVAAQTPQASAAAASNTLVVNANTALRAVTHVASGALYGLSGNGTPAERYVDPLHPSSFVQMAPGGSQLPNGESAPAGDALVVAPEAAQAGAKVIVRMPDWYPNFPYKWVSWSNWLSAIDSQVAAVKASGDSNIQSMEIWNEPDWTWDTTDAGSFDAGWVESFNEIRKDDSTIPIDGPSYSAWNESWMSSFLTYAKANNALPQYLSWHELSGQSNIAADVAACQALEASLGISPIPIVIEEYGETGEVGVPGSLVGYIAKFERAGVTEADLAFWNQYGTMGDTLVSTGGLPNAAWWLYKWYGDMSGEMVNTVPPAQTGIDGAASVNSAGNQVSVIFGGGSGSSAVTVNGLSSLSAFSGGSAHVVLQYVRSQGRTTAVSVPETISVGDYTISGGSITVPVNGMNAANGYHLVITPTGSTSSTLDGTYQLENVNSSLMLGVSGASTSSGAAALQWTNNGTRDHLWDLVGDGNGAYKIVNENSGLVLGVAGASTSSGAAVEQLTDDGDTGELWDVNSAGSGEYKIVNEKSGLVLGITSSSTASGATALQWTDNGTADHLWKLVSASDVTTGTEYTITNVNSGLNLDTQNAGTAAGTLVDQATVTGANDQQWEFVSAGNGEYKIVNVASGLDLGISNASTTAGAGALIWTDSGTADHLWQIMPNGNGSYLIANANSGLLLGVTNASTASGALALQWSDNGTADHLWRLNQG
ncbi:RICIN domain-containing protein [Actinospica durhamensis]|uniref:RICIN domain-containing protein n=1 Tax=Actinospica durhamensis TaxID=1508375 RepID=A0A941F0S2_9ACTN|nr:RICIN domain-containing protein [Actinospica durhamensis]MBR7839559.1 RICIN domain-containing protein [Actinospica durhamensis]